MWDRGWRGTRVSNELVLEVLRMADEIAYFLCKFFHLPATGRDCNALNASRSSSPTTNTRLRLNHRRAAATAKVQSEWFPAHVFRRCIPFADSHSATEQLPWRDIQNISLFRISALKKALEPWLLQSSQVYCLNNSMKSLNCTTDNFSVAHSSTPIHMCDPLTHDPILYPLSLHTVHRAVRLRSSYLRYFAADFSERVAKRSNRIQDIINSAA